VTREVKRGDIDGGTGAAVQEFIVVKCKVSSSLTIVTLPANTS
jgi:hypothetical protein